MEGKFPVAEWHGCPNSYLDIMEIGAARTEVGSIPTPETKHQKRAETYDTTLRRYSCGAAPKVLTTSNVRCSLI